MSFRKWDLAWVLLDPVVGHEQSGRRPVLVFCNEAVATPIGRATVLPLTGWKKGRRVYPTEVLVPAGTGGLPSASIPVRRWPASRSRYTARVARSPQSSDGRNPWPSPTTH